MTAHSAGIYMRSRVTQAKVMRERIYQPGCSLHALLPKSANPLKISHLPRHGPLPFCAAKMAFITPRISILLTIAEVLFAKLRLQVYITEVFYM